MEVDKAGNARHVCTWHVRKAPWKKKNVCALPAS
jgi:hypothetical protein